MHLLPALPFQRVSRLSNGASHAGGQVHPIGSRCLQYALNAWRPFGHPGLYRGRGIIGYAIGLSIVLVTRSVDGMPWLKRSALLTFST